MRRLITSVTAAGLCGAVALVLAPNANAQETQHSAALASASGLPAGETVWVQRTEYGWQMLQIWRTGSKVRIYHDDGGYPGDGFNCSWGTLRGQKFTGKVQRVAPDPIKVRYTIQRDGKKLRVLGLTGLKELDRHALAPVERAAIQCGGAGIRGQPGNLVPDLPPDQLNPAPGALLVRFDHHVHFLTRRT